MRILIVEDDPAITEPLAHLLSREGFETVTATSGATGLAEFDAASPDLVLLDLSLPGMTGLEVCRAMRVRRDVPVIVVSARDSEDDKVSALDAGADDYVTKPFSGRELIARIGAVRRRHTAADNAELLSTVLQAGPIRMDVDRHRVTVAGDTVALTLTEFQLLEFLLRNVNRMVSRSQLIERLWGATAAVASTTLDVHVKGLRTKIEANPGAPRHLRTIRGLGYRLDP